MKAATSETSAPAEQRIEAIPLTFRAATVPQSVNREARTVDVVWSTGAQVMRYDWLRDERFIEELSMKRSDVRLERLNGGAPLLNTHSMWDVGDVVGIVEPGTAKIADAQGVATVRFAKNDPDADRVWNKVEQGIVRQVSVGYRVHKYEQSTGEDGKIPIRRAVDWEPYEISIVPIGADPGAQVRAADRERVVTNPCVILTRSTEDTMKDTNGAASATTTTAAEGGETSARIPEPERRAGDPRAGSPAAVTVPVAAGAEVTETDQARAAERDRINGILAACEAARLPMTTARRLIDAGTSLLDAQTEILDTLRKAPTQTVGPKEGPSGVRFVGADPLENVWRGIGGALLHRIDPNLFPLDENARQYRTRSLIRCAEECLEQRGIRTRDMSKMDIAGLSLGLSVRVGLHTTSDFANILADTAGKTLRRAYETAPQTWQAFSRRINMPDFKPIKRNQMGEAPALTKVLEHGEFTRGTVAEGKEQFSLATYGRIFGITRQALVNDDLDAFGRLTMSFGRSARNLESDIVWYQILKNANMADGLALFEAATHLNLTTGPGTAIGIDSLGVGFAAMMNQKALDGATYLNLSPRFLAVPPVKLGVALQYTTAITPQQGSNVNPWAGQLTPVSEPRLQGGVTVDGDTVAGSATAWYLFASPDQIDIVEYGFLDGEDGPVIESRVGFDIDGLEIKCRHDFAAKAIDYRGAYKNVGA